MSDINDVNEIMRFRLEKLEEIRNMGIKPFGDKYSYTHHSQQVKDNFNELENQMLK